MGGAIAVVYIVTPYITDYFPRRATQFMSNVNGAIGMEIPVLKVKNFHASAKLPENFPLSKHY